MTPLAEWLWRACAELGLTIEPAYNVRLPTAVELTAMARIPHLGGANGMLIFGDYDEIRRFTQPLLDAGYAFSVLGEPPQQETFDLQSYKDMFVDWGWSGELGQKAFLDAVIIWGAERK